MCYTFNDILKQIKSAPTHVKADEYIGPVAWDSHVCVGTPSDSENECGYFRSVARLKEAVSKYDKSMPLLGMGYSKAYLSLDMRDKIVDELQANDYPEDAFDHVPEDKITELQEFVNDWITGLPSVGWTNDHSIVVVLDDVEFAALLKQTTIAGVSK